MSVTFLSNSWKQHFDFISTDEEGNKNLEAFSEALRTGKKAREKLVVLQEISIPSFWEQTEKVEFVSFTV